MCTSQLYRIANIFSRDGNYIQPEVRHYTIHKGANKEILSTTGKYDVTPIPCGKCAECQMQKAQEWAFRCMKEAEQYKNNVMLTLTYNDENVPKKYRVVSMDTGEFEWKESNKIKKNEFIEKETLTLRKKDIRNFMDKMRKHYGYNGLRYYYAGEYGDKFGRPHYHIICFNLKVDDMVPYKISKCEWSKEKNTLYKSKTIDKIWGKGFVDLNEVNYETACYVARYVQKKWKRIKAGQEMDEKASGKVPEYTCMSRKPGIGHAFFEKNKEKFENEETFWQRTKKGIREFRPGRYFDKQIEKENPELMEAIKQKRIEKSKERWNDILSKTGLTKEEYIANLVSKRENKVRFMKRQLI